MMCLSTWLAYIYRRFDTPLRRKLVKFPTTAERLEPVWTTSGQWAMFAGAVMPQL